MELPNHSLERMQFVLKPLKDLWEYGAMTEIVYPKTGHVSVSGWRGLRRQSLCSIDCTHWGSKLRAHMLNLSHQMGSSRRSCVHR